MSTDAQKAPFYYNDLFIVMSLFCCCPAGLILMWGGNKWTKGVRIGVTVGVMFMFIIPLLAPTPPHSTEAKNQETISEISAPKQVSESTGLEFVKESCRELSEMFGPSSQLSEVQKEELWKQYRGKGFRWNLQVNEVHSMLGTYQVQYKCAPTSDSLIADIQVQYKSAHKSFVLGLTKDGTYEVVGVLKRSGSILGMSGEGVVE